MAERKGGDGSFRAVVGEVLRAPIEFVLEQRRSGSRLSNTALVAVLLGMQVALLASVVQNVAPQETIVPQDFLPIVGFNVAIYVATGLMFYAREHNIGGPFIG